MRETWRTLLFVTKGKLHAAESAISSRGRELVTELIPAAASHERVETTERGAARAPWRSVCRTIVGALGGGMLVPLSALSAFTLPDAAVDRLGALIWSAESTLFASSEPSTRAAATLPGKVRGSETVVRVSPSGKGGRAADARVGDSGTARTPSPDRRGHSIPTYNRVGDRSSAPASARGGPDAQAVGGSSGSRDDTAGGGGGNGNAIGNGDGDANSNSNGNADGGGNALPPTLPPAPALPPLPAVPAPLPVPALGTALPDGTDAVPRVNHEDLTGGESPTNGEP